MQITTLSRESVCLPVAAGDLDSVYDALFGTLSATTDVKLELASAYIYLGDFDSARELLEAVLHDGTAAQAEGARSALASLSVTLS